MMRSEVLFATLLLMGCDPGRPQDDAGSCTLGVDVGALDGAGFTTVPDGGAVELVLGFQGFRMLVLALDVRGAASSEADVSAFLSIADTGVELSQRTRETGVEPAGEGFVVRDWLVFFNNEPPSRIVDHDARLEVIVRAAGCTGSVARTLHIRDDVDCIEHGIVLDAAIPDGGALDGAACAP
ncbi:MAG: hypothetical protein IT378_17805 [Sandaracinaceae bacterium]|nr:hypothetical protein [Sandaracinaceae bacterium]